MNYKLWALQGCLLGFSLSAMGCGPAEETSNLETVSQNLDPYWTTPACYNPDGSTFLCPYTWNQGQPPKKMEEESLFVCVLTKVKGDFSGYGEKLEVVAINGFWYLQGQSQQSGVGGEAYCFLKSQFQANGPNRWNSPQFVARTNGSCGTATVNTWGGHATTFVSGVSGKFQGGAEKVRTTQSGSVSTPSTAVAEGCQGAMEVKAQSFFAGATGTTQLAKYWSNTTFSQSCNSANRSTSCTTEIPMARTDMAMCHFVHIAGDFGGGGEVVRIYPKIYPQLDKEFWYLSVTAGPWQSGNEWYGRYIRADARCYLRDQR
jgi:hypothetical protein